jgi:hypothetical protein
MKIASTLAEFSVEPDGTVKVFVSLAVILVVALAVAITAIASKKARSENGKGDIESESAPLSKEIQDILDEKVEPSNRYTRRCNRSE